MQSIKIRASAIALALATVSLFGSAASARDAAQADMAIGAIETVATFHDAMPTGVTVAPNGRIFVNYPRWGNDVPFTVAELVDGKAVPYPDAAFNRADSARPRDSLISVQSVVADANNRLWILDTAAPGFASPVAGGAKLVAVDLASNKVVKTIVFGPDIALPTTYLNDVRFDLRQGKEGVAYITDSSTRGPGAVIVVDIASGKATRRLSGHASTSPDKNFIPVIDGQQLMMRPAGGKPAKLQVAADGIALSPDGATLYFCPLSSRHLYSVPTAALRDPAISEAALGKLVRDLSEKGASDGLEADAKGYVYAGDYEHHAVRRYDGRSWQTIAQSPEIQWPDTFSIGTDGYLYFTVNQLDRQPNFHEGRDLRQKPYKLLRMRIGTGPVLLK
jgi:sugar lactone lactonase YvrE